MGLQTIRILAAAILIAILALPGAAVAQGGVTVVTGFVTVDGQPAPLGTALIITSPNGAALGATVTGGSGFVSNQYRFDLQAAAGLEGRVLRVQAIISGVAQPVSEAAPSITFVSNRVFTLNVSVMETPSELPIAAALGTLINPETTEVVTSFDYSSARYQSFVPGLPGNTLAVIRKNSVLILTLKRDAVITVGGITYPVRVGTPTPIPIGSALALTAL